MKSRTVYILMGLLVLATTGLALDDLNEVAPPGEMDTTDEISFPSNSFTTIQTIGNAPGMDVYQYYNGDFGWTHTFSETGVDIMDVNLTIRAYDVDYSEVNNVYIDGVFVGKLVEGPSAWKTTTFSVDKSALADGKVDVWIDVDATHNYNVWAVKVDWSQLVVEWDYPAAPEFGSTAVAMAIILIMPAFAYLAVRKRE